MNEKLNVDEWTLVLLDLNGQEVVDISRFTTFTLDLKLNENSTLQFDIDLEQFERLCEGINVEPRGALYPQKTEVKVYLNGEALFGGIIATVNSSYQKDGKSLSCSADSYIQYFSRRFVNKVYTNTDRSAIAWDAIDTVQSVANGDLGVTQGSLVSIFNSDLTCDFRDVKSIVQLYTYAVPATYDFEITPDKVFNTYDRLGSDRPDIELVYPGNVDSVGVPRSSDSLANKVIGLGAGIGVERLQTIKENSESQVTYRVVESKAMFNSVERLNTLEENTEGVLLESYETLVIPNVKPRQGEINLNEVKVGDSIRFMMLGQRYDDDVNGMFRIYNIKVTVDENSNQDITLDFYKPDNGGGLSE